MKESYYYYIMWYKETDPFEELVSNGKKFDDFMERSKILPTEKMFYKTFLLSKWKDGK